MGQRVWHPWDHLADRLEILLGLRHRLLVNVAKNLFVCLKTLFLVESLAKLIEGTKKGWPITVFYLKESGDEADLVLLCVL